MNATRSKLLKISISAVGLMIVGAGLAWLLEKRESGRQPLPVRHAEAAVARATTPSAPSGPREVVQAASPAGRPPKKNLISPPATPAVVENSAVTEINPPVAPAETSPPPKSKEPIQDPIARVALSLVGKDDEAEAIWLAAINNPDLPANERKDLIEDLNEDGFADPKHLTEDDVALIHNRILLIERLAPEAMDGVNAAAFAEAHKDLVKMLSRATQ